MSETNRSEPNLTERQKQVLNSVSQEIMSQFASQYDLGLHVITAERSEIFDPEENNPDLKLRASVLASGITETYFAVRVDEPLDGDTSVPTYYSIVQVEKQSGTNVEGLDLCVGHILERMLYIEQNMIGFFSRRDLWTIRALSEIQQNIGFNPRLN